MKLLLTAVNAKYIHSNPAIYSLRAYAKEYESQIEPAEFTINQSTQMILSGLYKKKPDVLCFSCYIWNISHVLEIAEAFHEICPDVPIWLGGPEVSYEPKLLLDKHVFIKGIMMGEGEKIFRNLCRHYMEGAPDLAGIPGIAYRSDGAGARPLCINTAEAPLDMSTIPFAYKSMEDFRQRIVYYESSRGCPFGCSYCLSSIDKHLRFRDMELVKKELLFFIENEVPQVKFVDRTFNCESERAVEIWQFIREHDRGMTNFHFEVAADLMTEEALALIAGMRPGLIQLEIGVQSANERTITEIKRKMDLDRVKQVVEKIKEPGNVHQHLDLIAGLPFEDYQTFGGSFDEIYALKPQQLQLGFLKVLKGSAMEKQASEYGILYMKKPPYEVLQTKWLSYGELLHIKLVEEMLEVYYNSGQYGTTIALLEECFESAFSMFGQLGVFYEENGYLGLSHTRIKRLQILLEFAGQIDEHHIGAYQESAVYDLYKRENSKSRPAFAADMGEWKEVTRMHCKKGKLSHVERFYYNGKKRQREPYYVLFDYERRNPLDHQAWEERI